MISRYYSIKSKDYEKKCNTMFEKSQRGYS